MSAPAALNQAPAPNRAYAGTACFQCYRAPPDTGPLQRCGGCKRVRYCSTTCSKADWRDHKPFCTAFAAVRRRPHALLPPVYADSATASDPDALASRRQTHKAQFLLEDELLATALNRQPTMLESQLLWKEPRCAVCGDREADVEARQGADEPGVKGWTTCSHCGVYHTCSHQHQELGRDDHLNAKDEDGRTQCQTFQLATEIDEFMLRHALATNGDGTPPQLWVPDRILTKAAPLPANWLAYLASVPLPKPTPPSAQIYGVWLEALSPVFTLLAALRRFDATRADIAGQIHVRLMEETHSSASSWLPALEEFQHQLPALRKLEILALVPSTQQSPSPRPTPLPSCPKCTSAGRSRSIAQWTSSSTPPAPPGPLASPPSTAIALSLNRSFAQSDADTSLASFWDTQLRGLAQQSVPFVSTAMTAEEAADDLMAIKEWCKVASVRTSVVWGIERNPWAGGTPKLDGWEDEGFTRAQGWWFGVKLGW